MRSQAVSPEFSALSVGLDGEGCLECARKEFLSHMTGDARAGHFSHAAFASVVARAKASYVSGQRSEVLVAIPSEMIGELYLMTVLAGHRLRLPRSWEARPVDRASPSVGID